jgi:hypothetical protein
MTRKLTKNQIAKQVVINIQQDMQQAFNNMTNSLTELGFQLWDENQDKVNENNCLMTATYNQGEKQIVGYVFYDYISFVELNLAFWCKIPDFKEIIMKNVINPINKKVANNE